MNEKTQQLENKTIPQLLLNFSIPAIIGMMANSLYMIIDRLFVGNVVGADAIAGMSVTMPISFIIMAFGMLVGIGGGALVSIRLGEQKKEEAENILGNALSLLLIISVFVSGILLLTLDNLLTHFGASPQILPYGKQFISIILFGSIFQYISFGLSAIIRAEGNPRIAMFTLLINAGINIILDFVFIYWLGYGLQGTAVATVISQAISASWVLLHFRGPNSVLKLRLKYMALRLDLIKDIAAIGMAPFFMQMAASVIIILLNQKLGHYGGDAAIGAYGIISTVIMFIIMPIFGINQGSQPIIGYNYGARNYDRVKQTLKLAIVVATLILSLGFIALELFPRALLGAFTTDEELLKIGVHGMRLWILGLPLVGFQAVSANFFQAIGKAGKSMILSLLRQVIILIPLILILPHFWGLDGVWYAGPLSDLLAALITAVFLLAEIKLLDRQQTVINLEKSGSRG